MRLSNRVATRIGQFVENKTKVITQLIMANLDLTQEIQDFFQKLSILILVSDSFIKLYYPKNISITSIGYKTKYCVG